MDDVHWRSRTAIGTYRRVRLNRQTSRFCMPDRERNRRKSQLAIQKPNTTQSADDPARANRTGIAHSTGGERVQVSQGSQCQEGSGDSEEIHPSGRKWESGDCMRSIPPAATPPARTSRVAIRKPGNAGRARLPAYLDSCPPLIAPCLAPGCRAPRPGRTLGRLREG